MLERARWRWKQQLPLQLMVLPAIIIVFIYGYLPLAGLTMAFQKFNPAKGFFYSTWIGLENYRFVLSMPDTYRVIFNTIYIASMKMVVEFITPIVFALLLNEVRNMLVKRAFQTMVYLPHFLSWVILAGILTDILSPSNGIINQFLGIFGVEPIFFLASNDWFPFILVLSDVWKEFGFGTIIYLAALTSIDPSLYEASDIDGANRWRQTWHISLPGMAPIIVVIGTLSLGNILNAGFEQIFNLYNPLVYESGDVIDTLVYRIGLEQAQYGLAAAVGLFKSIVSLVLTTVAYFLAYRFANYRIF